jgi:hypothetical protein
MAKYTKQHLLTFALVSAMLSACEMPEDEGEADSDLGFRGVSTYNGLELGNGLTFSNGMALTNGIAVSNGLATSNGLAVTNGLTYSNGLQPTSGFMASEAGRKLITYLVECALPAGDSITKNGYTFQGRVGLAPEWKYGSCGTSCQEWVSACLLARTNEFGKKVQIDMRAPHSAIGTSPGSTEFNQQEGAFFGNLFSNPPAAYACMGSAWANAQMVQRGCTTGTPGCAIKNVNYLNCSTECTYTSGGTMLSCPNVQTGWGTQRQYSALITTYLKPYWMY